MNTLEYTLQLYLNAYKYNLTKLFPVNADPSPSEDDTSPHIVKAIASATLDDLKPSDNVFSKTLASRQIYFPSPLFPTDLSMNPYLCHQPCYHQIMLYYHHLSDLRPPLTGHSEGGKRNFEVSQKYADALCRKDSENSMTFSADFTLSEQLHVPNFNFNRSKDFQSFGPNF